MCVKKKTNQQQNKSGIHLKDFTQVEIVIGYCK